MKAKKIFLNYTTGGIITFRVQRPSNYTIQTTLGDLDNAILEASNCIRSSQFFTYFVKVKTFLSKLGTFHMGLNY